MLRCMDFVGYVSLPSGTTPSKLLFKAVYERRDPEIATLHLRVYIEDKLILDKQYDVTQDTLEILEEVTVTWEWGVARCPVYIGDRVSLPRASGLVIAAEGESRSTVANTPEGSCEALVPTGGNVEAMIVYYDNPLYVTGVPAYVFLCGSRLEEGVAKATIFIDECTGDGKCVSWSTGLILYAVAPEPLNPQANIVNTFASST